MSKDVDPPEHYNLMMLVIGWVAVIAICTGTASGCSCHVHFSQRTNPTEKTP